MEATTPLLGPAALENPIAVARGMAEGAVASKGAGYVAKKAGANEEQKSLIENLAFWAPGVARSLGESLGLGNPKVAVGSSPEGKGIGIAGEGGTRAGVAVTPEEIRIGGQFRGGKTHELRIPRNGAAPAQPSIEAPTIEGQVAPPPTDIPQPPPVPHPGAPVDNVAEGASNMVAMQNEEGHAMRIVSGLPPTPPAPPVPPPQVPPGPPVPPEISQGHISQDTAAQIGTMIAKLPPDLRAQATVEAHQTLSQSILQMGKVVTPSGQLEIITKPEQADKIAQRIINDEVKRQEKILAESQNVAETVPVPVAAPVSKFEQGLRVRRARNVTQEQAAPVVPAQAVSGQEQVEAPQNSGTASLGDFTPQSSGPAPSPSVPSKTGSAALSDLAPTNFLKGDQVVLPNGTKAQVSWVSQKMSIVRVKTDDGQVLSIGARKLKSVQPEPITQAYPQKSEAEPKFKHGSTQANIPDDSEAAKALETARQRVSPGDVTGKGTDVGGNHLTVRYGIKGEDTTGIREYLSSLKPFEATLGKTEKFPPSEHSDGAAVIHAPVEAPELHQINKEIEKHGEFAEPSFGAYKPHATVAYVKPDKADRYVGMSATAGKKFPVNSIAITDRNGKQEEIKLKGKAQDAPGSTISKEQVAQPTLKKESAAPPVVATLPAATRKYLKSIGHNDEYIADVEARRADATKNGGLNSTPGQRTNIPREQQLRDGISQGAMRLWSKVNSLGEKLSPAELKTVGEEVERNKKELAHVEPKPQAKESVQSVSQAAQTGNEIQPGKLGEARVSDLKIAPHKFQYKLGTDAEGVGALLKEQKVFNPDLAGVVTVWRDPADGKMYVVNGHHRVELAKRTGEKTLAVRHIKAKDAIEARAIGAQQNIAEGRGTAIDAAKYFRDTSTTAEDLSAKGISLGEATAKDGIALSHLDTPIFNRVVSGDLRLGRAIAIGEATKDPAEQKAILSLVEKKEARGGKVSDDTLSELIRLVKGSEQTTETTADLFGTQQINRSLALEKAEISAHIKQQLAKDKKLFGFVAKEDRATELARAGNKIDVEKSREISTGAAQAEDVYNKLSLRGGPIATILDEAAKRLADNESPASVKSDAYQRVRAEVSKTLGGSEGPSAGRPEGTLEPQRPAEAETRQPESSVEPTLPGMEHVPAERAEANAEQQGKDLTAKLTEPPKSIEGKAGEIEQKSPLFRDTEANPQRDMFGELLRDESGTFEPGKVAAPARSIAEYLKNEIETNKQARELHSGLNDLESQYQADVLRAVHTMENVGKELGKSAVKDFEQIYHHLENPEGVQLTPPQDKLLDETILPVMDESNRIYTKLSNGGVPAENYVHRVVKGKGGFFDRIIGGSKGSGRGNLLAKSSPQQKQRTMMALEEVKPENAYPYAQNTKAPERRVVSIKGGMVTAWKDGKPEEMGGLRSGLTTRQGQLHEKIFPIQQEIRKLQHERRVLSETPGRISTTFERRKRITEEIDKLERERDAIINEVPPTDLHDQRFVDKQGKYWEITQATTREIERHTGLKYYHNALASSLVSYLQLRKAERGFDFIESYKNSPEFSQIAQKQGEGNPPGGWKTTDLPQLRGYYFEPHTAEVLDHYSKKLKSEGPNIFDKIGQFLRTSIFFNPLIHTPNIAVHWAVEKGVPRGFAPTRWGRLYTTSVKAINAVTHQNKDFLDSLDAGAPLQSQREDTAKVTQLFFDQLTDALNKDEGWATKLAKAVGMSPVNLVKAVYRFSGKVTWVTNDIAFLQATYEKTAQGTALKDALKETAKHIPDYRLPVRIFNSTGLAKLMSNPTLTMFGAYHYGALKSYGEMAKSALGAGEPPPGKSKAGDVAHGWELLAGIGLVTFVLYPLLDDLAKKASGDPNARVRRAGAATLPYNLYLAAKHEKSAAEVTQAVVTPAVHTKTALELGFNRDFRTGRQIYDPAADWKTQTQEVGRRLAEAISPVGQGLRVAEDQGARKRFLWGLGGVSFPLHGAEKIASEIAQTKMPTQADNPKEREAHYTRRAILDGLRKGDSGPLEEARKSGKMSPDQIHTLIKRSRLTPLQDKIHGFTYTEAMQVYGAATPEQKKELDPIIREKRLNLIRKHRATEVTAVDLGAQ